MATPGDASDGITTEPGPERDHVTDALRLLHDGIGAAHLGWQQAQEAITTLVIMGASEIARLDAAMRKQHEDDEG